MGWFKMIEKTEQKKKQQQKIILRLNEWFAWH